MKGWSGGSRLGRRSVREGRGARGRALYGASRRHLIPDPHSSSSAIHHAATPTRPCISSILVLVGLGWGRR